MVVTFKDHCRVAAGVVVVLEVYAHIRIPGQVRTVECVTRKGTVIQRNEPFWMFINPIGINAHVVGHHVTGQAYTALPGAVAEIAVGFLSAQPFGDLITRERIG